MAQQTSGDGRASTEERTGLRLSGGAIASLAGLGLLVIFMVQNTETVTIQFLAWEFSWPLWLLSFVTALAGALVWFGLGVIRRHRRREARRRDRGR